MKTPEVIANRPPAVKEIHVVWMTTGLSCDGDSVSVTAASLPEHRGCGDGRHSRPAQGAFAQSGARLRSRRRFHEVLASWPPKAGSIPSCSCSKVRCPTKRLRAKAIGRRWEPTPKPASPSRPTNGLTGWRPRPRRSSARAPARLTAAFTPWKAIPPARWAWRIISAGTGARKPGCPSSMCPGCPVQPDNMMETLLYLLYQVAGSGPDDSAGRAIASRPGFSAKRFMKAATAAAITSRAISRTNTARPNAW